MRGREAKLLAPAILSLSQSALCFVSLRLIRRRRQGIPTAAEVMVMSGFRS